MPSAAAGHQQASGAPRRAAIEVEGAAARVLGVQRIEFFVDLYKSRREAVEQFDERDLHLAGAVVDRRVDQSGLAVAGAEEVSRPQVAVKQRRRKPDRPIRAAALDQDRS